VRFGYSFNAVATEPRRRFRYFAATEPWSLWIAGSLTLDGSVVTKYRNCRAFGKMRACGGRPK